MDIYDLTDLDDNENSDKKSKLYFEINEQDKKVIFFGGRTDYKMNCLKIKNDLSNVDLIQNIKTHNIREFTSNNSGSYLLYREPHEVEGENILHEIPNGFYNIGYSDQVGYFLIEDDCSEGDKFINLGGDLKIMEDTVRRFYDNTEIYNNLDLKHKMGCLFYGEPGNGKTMMIREIVKKYLNQAVVIFVDTQFPTGLIKKLKHYDSNYIFIFEELTQVMRDSYEIAQVLLFLDGEYSLNKQLTLATTNYPEMLPANLASRPGRFDKLIEVSNPSRNVRKLYMESLLNSKIDDKVLDLTKNMSIAYLKEIIISSLIDGIKIEEAIQINKKRIEKVKKSFAPDSKGIGLL